ncbi:MAG: metallophosphoesterase, partial [Aggregatilineales bacterium]
QNLARTNNKTELLHQLHLLGDEAAAHFRRLLPTALAHYKQLFIVMHPPPFQESVWHEGNTPDDDNDFLPHFACKAAGDVLLELVPQYPDCEVTVLCGHTHGRGEAQVFSNLTVLTGGAVYRNPAIQRIFTL